MPDITRKQFEQAADELLYFASESERPDFDLNKVSHADIKVQRYVKQLELRVKALEDTIDFIAEQ